MKDIVIIKNSNALLNNDVYFPDINEIENGELVLNNSTGKETLFVKNDADDIVPFRSKQYTLDKINTLIPTITVSETAPNKPKEGDFWIEPMPPIPFTLEFDVLVDDLSVQLPISGNVNCVVDWGDGGTKETITSDRPSHNYNNIGVYVVKVYGDFEKMYKCSRNVTKVISWGNSNTSLNNMNRAFSNCSNLTSIPDDEYGIFSNVTNFYLTFYYCTSLTSIPENLFQYSFKAEQIHNTFNHCTGLTNIPERLFANCSNVTIFDSAFIYCTSITSIPENLLINNYNVTHFTSMFSYCTSLTSIPENLFDSNKKVKDFSSTFQDCSGLTGNTPTGTDGLELWKRAGKPGYPSSINGTACFRFCSKLSNYSSIPSGWN